jgi:predicted ATP-dependent Lon-type protease
METFEQKALDYYGEVIINKHLIHEAGFGARAIPIYVGEWILSAYAATSSTTTCWTGPWCCRCCKRWRN